MNELLLFLEAFIISFLLTGVVIRFSLRRGLLDVPNDRSSHSVPKPRLGGVAIIASFYISVTTLYLVGIRPFPGMTMVAGILSAGVLIAFTGLVDDLRGLDARLKLAAQLAAAGIVVLSGVVLSEISLPMIGTIRFGPLSIPFTILWITGIVNFYNFIDGIDGLAAGVGMIASFFLLLIGVMTGSPVLGALYAVMAGSLLGFLRYNFPPARIFMGDMGSTFVGFLFGTLAVVGSGAGVPVFVTVLLLGSVIGDAALTLIRRAVQRKKIFKPHRTHYYQRLTSLGLSHKQVTLLEYLFAVLLGVSAVFTFHGDRMFVSFFAALWVCVFLWALLKIRSMERGGRLFWEGKTLAVALADLFFVAASYTLSYYLRLNFSFPRAETASMLTSLPIVLVVRTAVFFYHGHYRAVWRYTTFDDLVRTVRAVSLGTAVMIVSFTLLFRFEAFPRSVFIIDWFVLTVFLTGSRIATRWFHDLPLREEVAGRRVIIGGMGSVAELIFHQLKKTGGYIPLGYLDDRTEMVGRMVHGIRVLGSFADAAVLAKRHDIEEILVTGLLQDRFPADVRAELIRSGVKVTIVSDPSDISRTGEGIDASHASEGKRVVVAGNGLIVERAGAVFANASELTVISNESRPVEAAQWYGDNRHTVYFGVLESRHALREILLRKLPDIVVTEFRFTVPRADNVLEAYLRSVMLPVQRLASEAAGLTGTKMVAVIGGRRHDATLEEAERALENLLIHIFGKAPERLVILRLEREVGVGRLIRGTCDCFGRNGGVYRPVAGEGAGRLSVEVLAVPEPSPDISTRFLELTRTLDEGNRAKMPGILREMGKRAVIQEHDR